MPKRILVVGELNVDLILSGMASFPALGHEIISRRLKRVLGGSSAICAAGLARLGVPVTFLGKVGADENGEFVTRQLRKLGVATDQVIGSRRSNTGLTISLAYPTDRALITYPGCISHLTLEDVDLDILDQYQHLHVGSYFLQKGLQPGLTTLFSSARRHRLTISLDPGGDPEQTWGGNALLTLLDQVDIFLPNEREACAIADEDETEIALFKLAKHAGQVVIKRGHAGATTLQHGRIVHSPGFHVRSIDPTGAGDSFDAGLVYARVIRGLRLARSLEFANACGALATTRLGGTAAQPTESQVVRFLREHPATQPANLISSQQDPSARCGEVKKRNTKPIEKPLMIHAFDRL